MRRLRCRSFFGGERASAWRGRASVCCETVRVRARCCSAVHGFPSASRRWYGPGVGAVILRGALPGAGWYRSRAKSRRW
eukprot:9143358-Pyramimonas_sp.AAC.1